MNAPVLSTEQSLVVENRFLGLRWDAEGLTAMEKATGKMLFRKAKCRVSDFDGEYFDLFSLSSVEAIALKEMLILEASLGLLAVKLTCVLEGVALRFTMELRNLAGEPYPLGMVSILRFERAAGSHAHLLADPVEVFSLGASTGETGEMWSKEPGNMRVFALKLHGGQPRYVTDNMLALRPVNALGLTAEATYSFDRISEVAAGFEIDLEEGVSEARAAFRGAVLAPGATRILPTLTVDALSPVDDALDAAVDRIVDLYQPALKSPVPSGWCSWYYYYPHVTEEDILENLRFLAANRERFPYEYVQIDDGYQLHWGDWLLPGRKFPHDMAWLAREIKSLGFKPGIWVAPTIMTVQSHLYRDHADWALKDLETGAEMTMKGWSPPEENPWVLLDGTHPEFLAHIKRVFATMAHDWGYDYFKLDATAFAAYAGQRHDPTKTGIEAVRMVIEAIREAVGPDKYILGCAVPFGAAIGLVDGERVSDDVSTAFRAGDGFCPISVAMPQSIHRSFIHGKWWHNDPDCVLVRSQGTPHNEGLSEKGMSLDEAQFFTTVVGLTQGIQMVGENMLLLEEERLRLLDAVQPMMPAPAKPLDLFSSQPERLLSETPAGNVLGLLNWGDSAKSFLLRPEELGLSGEVEGYELWSGEHVASLRSAPWKIEVPAHGSRVLFFRSTTSHPSFLGFDGHISAGGSLLEEESWDAASGTLHLKFKANRPGRLSLFVPQFWMPVGSELRRRQGLHWDMQIGGGLRELRLLFSREDLCKDV